jgi:hypothetical protein
MKTYVYVDAFNLYFGAVRGTAYKWLNLADLCRILLPRHSIEKIKYFTAIINARPNDTEQPRRQATYLRALKTIPDLEIYYGHFLTHAVWMPLANPTQDQPSYSEVIKTEEKGSDVNLACQLLHDAHMDRFECAVIMSGDSDLLMPVRIVMDDIGKPVGVINPQPRPCRVLEKQATFYKHIRKSALARSQFPRELTDARGTLKKPPTW